MIRHTLKAFGLIIMAVAFFSCKTKPTPQEAVSYNDKVVEIHTRAINSLEDITNAFDKTPADLQAAHKGAIDQAAQAIEGIKKLGPIEGGNTGFYDAAISYLTMHKQVLETDYKKIVELMSKEEASDEDIDEVEKLMTETESKYAKGDEDFEKAQIAFAKEYGFEIAP
jgi:hypothetical protein